MLGREGNDLVPHVTQSRDGKGKLRSQIAQPIDFRGLLRSGENRPADRRRSNEGDEISVSSGHLPLMHPEAWGD
jgi:hypothetical protein